MTLNKKLDDYEKEHSIVKTQFKNYEGDKTESGDYAKIHHFLAKNKYADYTYGRFDWMMTNWDYLEDQYLNRIGIWQEVGEVVGVTLFDHSLDVIFPLVQEGYEELYGEMIEYAKSNMIREENPDFLIYANDSNERLKNELKCHGFIATEWQEKVAKFDCINEIAESSLAEGYAITTLQDEEDFEKYFYCMFKGFDHEQEGEVFSFDSKREKTIREAYHRNFLDRSLKISIKNPNGDYVAHCGMWYDPNSELALIEPVCVIPEYRKMGFGREVVKEGIRRVKEMGAKSVVVGSDQQFYYSLGMVPYTAGTLWKPKKTLNNQ